MLGAILLVILTFQTVRSAPVVEPKVNGLYSTIDNVTILTGNNFKKIIFNSPFIWMVEFYSSWCGHCQEFAPTYKAFARNIADWQEVYRLAVINCPDEINLATCRSMEVSGYPSVRVFPPFSNFEEPGIKIDELTVERLRNTSVEFIIKYLDKVKWNLPGILKPTFDFITYEDILQFQIDRESPHHYLAVVIEEETSAMGKELILDMSSCRNISTRRFDAKSRELKKLQDYSGIAATKFPAVIVFVKGKKAEEIEVEMRYRNFFSYKLHLLPGIGDPQPLPKQKIGHESDSKRSRMNWMHVDRGKVYMADVESALHYALTVEVGSVRELYGDRLDAIKNFVGTLALFAEHFPISSPSKNFLVRLTGWLASHQSISHETWQKRMEISEPNSYLPRVHERWVGCAPSKEGLRGYPCSLWTLFHALTVAAFHKKDTDVQAIPRAMESYISNFFTCMECRKNFIRELSENPFEDRVKSYEDAIIWLWELHNRVNKRLHGSISEDPNMPKVQFPPSELCPDCRNSAGDWNKENVSKYLTELYGDKNVLKDFLDVEKPLDPGMPKKDLLNHRLEKLGSDFDKNFGVDLEFPARLENDFDYGDNDFNAPRRDPVDHALLPGELLKDRTKDHSIQTMKEMGDQKLRRQIWLRDREWHNPDSSNPLSGFDASLCFFLWGISMLAVMFMFLYMTRRSTRKFCKI